MALRKAQIIGFPRDAETRENFKRLIEVVNALVDAENARETEAAIEVDAGSLVNDSGVTLKAGDVCTFGPSGTTVLANATDEGLGPAFVVERTTPPGEPFKPINSGGTLVKADGVFAGGQTAFLSASVPGAVTATKPNPGNYQFIVGKAKGPVQSDGRVLVVLFPNFWQPKRIA